MTSSTPSDSHKEHGGAGQKRLIRVTTLEAEISKLIPVVARRLTKEGYGKLTQSDIALALSSKTSERILNIWKG